MLRYELADTDLGDIRFGISPLTELGLSLRALKEPSAYPLQLPWLRRTEAARATLDLPLLMSLVNDRLWTPDFLNPRPASPLTRIEQELAALRSMPSARFWHYIEAVHERMPRPLLGEASEVQARITEELERYWHACIGPHWARMRTILEADIAYRGRQVAQSGLSAMLNGLSPRITFEDSSLNLRLQCEHDASITVGGLGVTLVPTMFTRRVSAPILGDEPPLVLYPARGQGAMWERVDERAPGAVAALLGETRTRLLLAVGEPASSTELGMRFGVTTSAVNQHLRALAAGGLVTATRNGRSTLYVRSELGTQLIGDPTPETRTA